MQGLGLVSTIAASIYVAMMALYYAKVQTAQGELESEMRRRIEDLRSDIEAERGVLEARLQELVRRYGSTAAVRGS